MKTFLRCLIGLLSLSAWILFSGRTLAASRSTLTPATTQVTPPVSAAQFVRLNSLVVVAFVISLSVLVAVIVSAGSTKKRN